MPDPGVHNPRRNMLICLGVTFVAWAFLVWGAIEMVLAGGDTVSSGIKIGLALLPAIIGPLAALNFWWAIRVFAAIRRGENQIGRWTVTPADLAEFAVIDDARNAHGGEYANVWARPGALPPEGLEIIFAADGVLVGNVYYALVPTGMFKFTRVGMLTCDTPIIEFLTSFTLASGGNTVRIRTTVAVLRLPTSHLASAEVARVLDHFQRVAAREIIANPQFYPRRMRVGLIGAAFCFAVAATGFWLDGDGAPDLMLGLGVLFGTMMLVLALAAWVLNRRQYRAR